MWKAIPESISANCPGEIHRGATEIFVSASSDGTPLENAVVSVWFFDGDPYTAITDEDGIAVVSFPNDETIDGDSLSIVVKKPGYIPHIATIPIVASDDIVSLAECTFDDDASGESDGNDDGILSAGEQIEISPSLTNLGTTTMSSISARIVPDDEHYTIVDTVSAFGDIASGSTVSASAPMVIRIKNSIADSTEMSLRFKISSGEAVIDTCAYHTYFCAPRIVVQSVIPAGDGVFSPGETTTVDIVVKNEGTDEPI